MYHPIKNILHMIITFSFCFVYITLVVTIDPKAIHKLWYKIIETVKHIFCQVSHEIRLID